MHRALDPRYQYCTRVGESVAVCRSESECRREHGCTKAGCPLKQAFGLKAFDERMRAYSTAFDLWPVENNSPPDFP